MFIFQNDFKYLLLIIYTNPRIVQETLIIHPCAYILESVPELPGAETIKSVLLDEPDYISKKNYPKAPILCLSISELLFLKFPQA